MGLKIKCYWEVLWKHIGKLGNTLGTPWELDGNSNQKKIPPLSLPPMAGFLTQNWWKNEILNPPCLGNNSACDNP
jgi:hypothetical protein